jgi:L-fuconolactonase
MSRKCGEPPLSPWWDESKASMTKTLLGEELWIQTSRLLLHAAARMHDDDLDPAAGGSEETLNGSCHHEASRILTQLRSSAADYRAGARVLARMGLSLDTGVVFPQLPELADFAKAVPDLTIILNHLGGLTRVGPYGSRDDEVLATWRSGIAAVAACPNVNLKLGGIGMPRLGFDWHTREKPIGSEELAASMAPFMTYCIERFGPDRCMFESNFPPDKVSFSHHVLFNAFKRFSKGYSASERAILFHDTAVRAYRISDVKL